MISVIVPTLDSAKPLQVLLPALVPAAVDGLVREVIAADAGSTDPTPLILDDAGASLVEGGVIAAAAAARGDLVMFMGVDFEPRPGWIALLRAHLERGGGTAVLRGARAPGLAGRLMPAQAALLIDRGRLAGVGETRDVPGLARRLGRGRPRL